MNKKYVFAIFLVLYPFAVGANSNLLSFPKNGIHVVPLPDMNIQEEHKEEVQGRAKEQKEKGYDETESSDLEPR